MNKLKLIENNVSARAPKTCKKNNYTSHLIIIPFMEIISSNENEIHPSQNPINERALKLEERTNG